VHALLAGGEHALDELLPGFGDDLQDAGAVVYRVGLDTRMERPGFDPFAQRDLGLRAHSMSRALVEWTLRRRVQALGNVEVRDRCRVRSLRVASAVVTGVTVEENDGMPQVLPADLVVDATGRGAPTLELLEALGGPMPSETSIGVDLRYASTVFRMPEGRCDDWIGVLHYPQAPQDARGAIMLPIEGGPLDHHRRLPLRRPAADRPRRLHGVPARHAHAHAVRSPARRRAGRADRALRLPGQHVASLRCAAGLPGGLLATADSLCRFNPIYGQGMSVASQEAALLCRLLAGTSPAAIAGGELACTFFREAQPLIEAPWAMSALPDFVYPDTRGERPPDMAAKLQFTRALFALAARDAEVHKLTAEVQHLLKPQSAYRDPALVRQVMAQMAPMVHA
jgi:2-polyprenyl-6-methoxyphenol hydroxylase-like FAD-dependent oxidoreductase